MSERSTSSTPTPPRRARTQSGDREGRALALAALGALGVGAVVGWGGPAPARLAAAGLGALTAVIALGRASTAAPVATLSALLGLAGLLPIPWQAMMALALAAYAGLARALPATARASLAQAPGWRARGRALAGWTALVGGVTPVALLSWLRLLRPDLSDLGALVPRAPLVWLVLGGLVFAVVNATLEELVWRGRLQEGLEAVFGARVAALLQAVSFGVQHAHGVPRGVVGVLLAGVWAGMLGVLRRRSGGLLAPVLAHVVADAAIAVIVLGALR